MSQLEITVAHSPDADDAFMFHALANDKIDTGELTIHHELKDIQTLNERAMRGELQCTAVSYHAYPYIADKYVITRPGASMGDRYGPIVVTREPLMAGELAGKTVATPGPLTSAYLALMLYEPECKPVHMGFDAIQDAVKDGKVDAGVIIHEGQVTYNDWDLYKLVDLGEWWWGETKLPLPLGCNVALRELGDETIRAFSKAFSASIQYALDNREEALDYALTYGRGLARERADKFVGMYVNDYTVDIGETGIKAVHEFLKRGREAGIITNDATAEWI